MKEYSEYSFPFASGYSVAPRLYCTNFISCILFVSCIFCMFPSILKLGVKNTCDMLVMLDILKKRPGIYMSFLHQRPRLAAPVVSPPQFCPSFGRFLRDILVRRLSSVTFKFHAQPHTTFVLHDESLDLDQGLSGSIPIPLAFFLGNLGAHFLLLLLAT